MGAFCEHHVVALFLRPPPVDLQGTTCDLKVVVLPVELGRVFDEREGVGGKVHELKQEHISILAQSDR